MVVSLTSILPGSLACAEEATTSLAAHQDQKRPAADAEPQVFVDGPAETLELEVGAILIRRPLDGPKPEDRLEGRPSRPVAIISQGSFDRFLFGSTAVAGRGRVYINTLLEQRIDEIASTRRLTPPERAKLLLAGRGDIKRLFERIDDERQRFEALRRSGKIDQCERFFESLLPLRRSIPQGPFGPGSLFAKTLKKLHSAHDLARSPTAEPPASTDKMHAPPAVPAPRRS
jgi:hypothetical protein